MNPTIQQIRRRLRLAMDGVVSSSMRAKGVNYKLNFGVTLPRLKEIACEFTPDAALAEELWEQDVRELKILATLLYPREQFTPEKADKWVRDIRHIEIAEQFCANLMENEPFAPACAAAWIQETDGPEYVSTTGYILYARLFIRKYCLPPADAHHFLHTAHDLLLEQHNYSRPQRAALTALERYGRQGEKQAAEALSALADFQTSPLPEKQAMYNDLKFEFDYSL